MADTPPSSALTASDRDDRAEAETSAADTTPPKRKMPMLIGAAIAAIVAIGSGAYFGYQIISPPEEEVAAVELANPIYVDIPPLIANLNMGGGQIRYLKAKVMISVVDQETATLLTTRTPEINDSFMQFFRELRPEDLTGAQGAFRIKEELLMRATEIAGPDKIRDVLIQEMVQQ